MTILLHVVILISLVVFITAVVVRFYKTSKMPLHLRWEIYPVAHEKHAEYGGSYMEKPDWWKSPRETSKLKAMKSMAAEILLLKGVWEHNRSLWYRSFPFHFGLYLLVAFAGLLILGSVLFLAGMKGGFFGKLFLYIPIPLGFAGIILALVGSIGLLHRRLTDENLKGYTSAGALFNLVFFIVVLGFALAAAIADPKFLTFRLYFMSLFKFSPMPLPGLTSITILLGALLVAYIPLTHMAHFFLKWFTWDKIRWDDEPNVVGGEIEKKIQANLGYKVSWSAPHIKGGGTKTWADVATEGLIEEEEKEKAKAEAKE